MRRVLAVLALWAPSLAAQAAAALPAFPAFPATTERTSTGRWLASQTDLPLPNVVLVGPGYVFSFVPPDPVAPPGGPVWKDIREEVTSQVMADRLGGRSATATLAFDCARGQATASNVIVYAGNNLLGDDGRSVSAAEWLAANPGLYLMDLSRAACDPRFRGPFGGRPIPAQAGAPRAVSPGAGPEPSLARPSAALANSAIAEPREAGVVHWVQVGAFTSVAAAEQRWRAIQRMLPAQSAARRLQTERAGRGKTLIRALAGPFHGAEADRFCAALRARGGDCLVR